MLAPVTYRPRGKNRIARRIGAILWEPGWPLKRGIRVAKEYDTFTIRSRISTSWTLASSAAPEQRKTLAVLSTITITGR